MTMYFKIFSLLIFSLYLSCSHVEYGSHSQISVAWTAQLPPLVMDQRIKSTPETLSQFFLREQKIPFYFFGLVPSVQYVYLDEIAQEERFLSLSRLSLYERPTWDDVLFSLITLGIYTPRSVRISGMGIKW